MKKTSPDVRGIIVVCILVGIALTLFWLNSFNSPGWWLGLLCAGFAVFLIWSRIQAKKFSQLPEQTTEATVVAKNAATVREDTSASGRGDGSDSSSTYRTYYKISFDNKRHEQWSFDVSFELFNAVSEGDCGTLIYKETAQGQIFFIDFIPQGQE